MLYNNIFDQWSWWVLQQHTNARCFGIKSSTITYSIGVMFRCLHTFVHVVYCNHNVSTALWCTRLLMNDCMILHLMHNRRCSLFTSISSPLGGRGVSVAVCGTSTWNSLSKQHFHISDSDNGLPCHHQITPTPHCQPSEWINVQKWPCSPLPSHLMCVCV